MIPFLRTEGSITLHYNGKTATIAKGDARFEPIKLAIRENRTADVIELADNELYFTKQGLKVQDGVLQLEGEDMPLELSQRILGYKEEKLPITSLLAFWENLKKNPSFNSRAMLFKFLENKGHSLTEDGCFIGYRGVTSDLKDRHSGKFDNSPGSVCAVPRESVDDNPNNTCSYGLHVGGYEYAKDFGRGGKLVLVKVNPADVVAVPNDYNGQKMRVCRFEVLKEATDIVDQHVVSADGGDYDEELDYTELDYYDDEDTLCDDCQAEEVADLATMPMKPKHNLLSPKRSKKSYANNHAKRGPDGKFIPKKKKARKAK